MIEVAVLGPVEVRRGGKPLAVPTGKASELLVRLAVEAGVPVRTERLLDDLWLGDAPTRRNTLQSKVTMLRRALGDPALLVHASEGYRLTVDPAAVDAIAVVTSAGTATRLLDDGDHARAVAESAAGLARFRGELLPSAGDGEWVAAHRSRLEAAHATLLETWFTGRAALGDDGDLIGELELAVAAHPFQEGLWRLLITGLYRAGRQADALATYQRVRDRLADELGLDTGPALQHLEHQILTHDPTLLDDRRPAPGLAPASRSGTGPARAQGNLPALAADLVGRETDLAGVAAQLQERRLVTIVGTGGLGKTALAIEVARRAGPPDGAWLARLETATTPNEVIDTLISAFGASGEAALFERVREMEALIVLDNCEHITDAVADLVPRLLDAAPGVSVLCTSQVVLGIEGEALFHLEALQPADAVELFTRLASAQRRSPALTEAGGAIADLCRSLDGLPLAIELAAARTRSLSVEEIVRRLDDNLDVLHDPASRRPERRRALRSTIGWSYELLFPDDQRGLWAVATFAGGAPLAGVEAVLAALEVPPRAALDVIDRLVSRSLVLVDHDETGGAPRYRLLDSIRSFSLEAMAAAGASDQARAAHAAWFAAASRTSTAGVRSAAQAEHLAFARVERANIDAALSWLAAHDPHEALAVADGFGWAWVVLGDSRAAERIVAALDAAGPSAPVADRATALLLTAWIVASLGDLERARAHIAEAVELAEGIDDADLVARAGYYLAYVVSHDGDYPQAMQLTARSIATYAGLDRPWDEVAAWLFAARAAIYCGEVDRATEGLAEAQRRFDVVDDPWLRVRTEGMLGELARIEHRFDDAVVHIRWAAEEAGRLGFLQTEAYQLSSLGRAESLAGDDAAGAATLTRSVAAAERSGDVRMAALARLHLGRVLRASGDADGARAAIETSMAWHRATGDGEQAAMGECLLAALDARAGDPTAPDRLAAVLAEARADQAAHVEVFALDALARLASDAGDPVAVADLLARADERMAVASDFISERDRVDARAIRTG